MYSWEIIADHKCNVVHRQFAFKTLANVVQGFMHMVDIAEEEVKTIVKWFLLQYVSHTLYF